VPLSHAALPSTATKGGLENSILKSNSVLKGREGKDFEAIYFNRTNGHNALRGKPVNRNTCNESLPTIHSEWKGKRESL
jgi:hypothetical protein